jgi:hypothetical protein
MMALAAQENVEALLLRKLTEQELPHVRTLLDMASSVVMRYARLAEEPSPLPSDLVFVTAEMVARLLRNPEGFTSEMLGPYQYQRPSNSFTLTPDLLSILGRYGSGGMVVLSTTSVLQAIDEEGDIWGPYVYSP